MDWQEILTLVVVAVASGVIVWLVQSRYEAIRRETERLHNERRNIYLAALEPTIRVFAGVKNRSETKRALIQLSSFEHRRVMFELNLVGSDEVVRAVNDYMQSVFKAEPDLSESLGNWGRILLAIRKDLGDRKTKLNHVDMLRSQITDIDKVMST